MNSSDHSDFNRRRLLKIGAAAAIGGVCFSAATIKQALAQAGQSGKPLLTEKNLNALAAQKDYDALQPLLQDASKDIKGFLGTHFFLTHGQEKELNSLSNELITNMQNSFEVMMHQKADTIVIRFDLSSDIECRDGYSYYCTGPKDQRICTATYTKCHDHHPSHFSTAPEGPHRKGG